MSGWDGRGFCKVDVARGTETRGLWVMKEKSWRRRTMGLGEKDGEGGSWCWAGSGLPLDTGSPSGGFRGKKENKEKNLEEPFL